MKFIPQEAYSATYQMEYDIWKILHMHIANNDNIFSRCRSRYIYKKMELEYIKSMADDRNFHKKFATARNTNSEGTKNTKGYL